MTFPTPLDSFIDSIGRWEGTWQAHAADSGNWVNCPDGRRLIGTMRGVTPNAYAHWLHMSPCHLDAERMREEITLEVAARIGVANYYDAPGFDDLEWSPLAWIAVDIGWGSGPVQGVRMLQQLIGATADGVIGPQTQKLYARYIHDTDIGAACDALSRARRAFYIRISPPGDKDHMYQRGWLRRADYYTTAGNGIDTSDPWWPKWAAWEPSGANDTGRPVAPPEVEPPEPPAAPADPAPYPADVAAIQRACQAAGIDPGPIDGIPGPLTRAAVARLRVLLDRLNQLDR